MGAEQPDAVLELLYEIAHVAIVPMRYGGGVKGKVLEAMRFGVPVATTSVGIQGIPNSSNIASVSDDAQGLANAVIRLLADPTAAKAQTVAAVRFLEAHYSQTRAEELLALDIPEFRLAPSKTSRATA
ncbi:MAG: glycosyltransferase [Deltaproteobacteria bacterium]|nr:glycosyltransferase [Deltaproteobacteria bacterium]